MALSDPKPRRRAILASGAALLIAAATACGGSSAGGSADDGDSGGGGEYTIAFQGPLTGDNAQLGINAEYGMQLAIQEANDAKALPYTLKGVYEDDGGDPAQSPAVANRIAGNSNVIAVVGPIFSGATKAAEGTFSASKLLSVTPSATRADLTSSGFTTFFRAIGPDSVQGSQGALYIAKGLKAKTAYVISDKSDYGQGLSDTVIDTLKQNGVTVTTEGVPSGTKDYSATATKLRSAKPDAVYYGGYYADAALLIKAVRAAGYTGPIMSGDGSNDDKLVELAGSAANGVIVTCPCSDARVDPKAKDFLAAYKAKFKVEPGTYSPETYDATNAIISVLKKVGAKPTREAVVEAFRSVEHQGLTTLEKFTENGELTSATIFLYEVKDGKRLFVSSVDDAIK